MSASENHIPTGNWRRLTAATMLALALASGAMAATTGTADAAVAKPMLAKSTIVATPAGAPHTDANIAPSASVQCKKRACRERQRERLQRKLRKQQGKVIKRLRPLENPYGNNHKGLPDEPLPEGVHGPQRPDPDFGPMH
ncbi:hypothetical protein ACFXJ8_43210 [Nonomuraea sp. NPDC059194]|uniref:hypothetical protein n=1 Tax=Nonomuraea sp. NPDC059194 TaxID=3346764 RepID=UPI0036CD29D3